MKKALFTFILLILVPLLVISVDTNKAQASWEDPAACWLTYPITGAPPGIGTRGYCSIAGPATIDCCKPGYMCDLGALGRANLLGVVLCLPIPPIPSNECKLTNVGASGTFLEADCNVGQVCPSSGGGAGACVTCSPGIPGICYKQPFGTLNSCCGGYMCPDTLNPGVNTCVKGNVKVAELLKIINGIVLPLAVILGMILIVHNGYKLMTSQGDPTKLQEGKDGLTSAIIGLLFILMAVSILRVIIKALISGDTDPFSQ